MKKLLGYILLGLGIIVAASSLWNLRDSSNSGGNVKQVAGLGKFIDRKPRSIVLITTDTTRADSLQPYGAQNVRTPNLQRLADEGVLMEQAFAVAPLTLPAHTTILTGLYPPQTGVRNNGTHFVNAKLHTMAERLTENGYRSGAFVSAAVLERRYGLDQGFEIYDDDMSKSRIRSPRMVPDRPAEFTVAAAREWLDTIDDDQPFFIWVHLYDPHAAYNPPPPFRDEYRTNPYAGEIAYMDAQIGDLLAHPRIEQVPGVAVAIIGDHGESLGEHGENTHGILAYQSTLHVPWILWVDDVIESVRLSNPVSQIDLMPTLLDMVGLLEPEDIDELPGSSLLNTVSPNRGLYSESYLPFYTYGWAKLQVMRQGGWELIDAPEEELYDLRRDPRELSNQLERREELAHDLRGRLQQFWDKYAPEGDKEQELEVDQESLERLRALGYIAMGSTGPAATGERKNPVDMVHLHTALERARLFSNDQLYEEAVQLLEGLLVEDPNNLAALTDLASAHVGLNQLDEAFVVIESALALAPDHGQLLLMLARVERSRGEADRALALTDHVLELNPTNMAAWQFKAQTEFTRGEKDNGKSTLGQALEVEPQHPITNTMYAQFVEIPDGEYDKAELRLRKATARDPYQAYPWRTLGGLLEHLGRLDEAETAYREGLEHSPDDPSLHALLAVQLAKREHPDAEAHLREAIRYESEFRGELYVSLGAELARKGRIEEAREFYNKVLEVDPGNAAAINNRAIALARSGDIKQAVEALQDLTNKYPDYADAHNNLAVLMLQTGNNTGAAKYAGRATILVPTAARAWDTLGAAQFGLGKYKEAEFALNRSLELRPDYWSAHLHRGLLRVELGEFDGARQDLESALATGGPMSDAYLALAHLHDRSLGNPGNAIKYYRVFLEKFPADDRAGEAKKRLLELKMGNSLPQ